MAVRAEEIASILREQIEGFGTSVVATDVGTIIESGDGVARIHGLSGAMYSELLEFSNGSMGIALNLEEETVAAVVLGECDDIKEGDEVRSTGRIIEIPVGDSAHWTRRRPARRAHRWQGPYQHDPHAADRAHRARRNPP